MSNFEKIAPAIIVTVLIVGVYFSVTNYPQIMAVISDFSILYRFLGMSEMITFFESEPLNWWFGIAGDIA